MDPHTFPKMDPHSLKKLDPDPHKSHCGSETLRTATVESGYLFCAHLLRAQERITVE
jgi:hypothetical protein